MDNIIFIHRFLFWRNGEKMKNFSLWSGPAYPFILNPILYPHAEQGMKFPTYPESAVGGRWIHT